MNHTISTEDARFREDFAAGKVAPADFNHRAHLRLAYVLLCEHDLDSAYGLMRDGIQGFLSVNDVDPAKYHETMTQAWMMAVKHFMMNSSQSRSFEDFAGQHPVMLDPKIMMTHYSHDTLFSPAARAAFVEPDIDPIPRYP